MRTMILDTETLPEGAARWRDICRAEGIDWRDAAPPWALEQCPAPSTPELRTVPRTWKDPAKIAEREAENLALYEQECADLERLHAAAAMSWWRSGSLLASRATIHTAAWCLDGEVGHVTGDDEAAVLAGVSEAIANLAPSHIVAWNAPFDAGMLFGRAMRHRNRELARQVAAPHYRVIAQLKLYSRLTAIIDAADLWPLPTGRREGEGKLDTVCDALGIERLDNPISGAEVLDAYMDGRDVEIVEHCRADVYDLWRVWVEELAPVYGLRQDGPGGAPWNARHAGGA